MEVQNRVINPDNLLSIGFTEYLENGIQKFKRGADSMWFTGKHTFAGDLTTGLTFSAIALEIIVKGSKAGKK